MMPCLHLVPSPNSATADFMSSTGFCRRTMRSAAAPGLYVVDGAALTRLPAKAHTLTIMANADRIARKLAQQLSG
jgi:hypothetical protein